MIYFDHSATTPMHIRVAEKVDFINQVPIVPVMQISSFLHEFYGNLDKMKTIEK